MSRILVVDDEPKMRALLAMALGAEGMTVAEAGSAEEALEALSRGGIFDVMVTDVRMPGLSGLELVKLARKDRPALECIVMTAHADAGTGVEAMRNGALEYVTKPFEMRELLDVHEAIAGTTLHARNTLQKDTFRRSMEPHLHGTGELSSGSIGRPSQWFRRAR